jgi:hypothetical protein
MRCVGKTTGVARERMELGRVAAVLLLLLLAACLLPLQGCLCTAPIWGAL